ncbi:hypothetical protein [Rhizorhabdus sp.]|uniref:hypothetical protein n=1 Tax=Rhizorhabdus sp. TaxID=1968843 RepID=UPI0035B1F5FE
MIDLWNVTKGCATMASKPRAANLNEMRAYLIGLAEARGFDVSQDVEVDPEGITLGTLETAATWEGDKRVPPVYSTGAVCIPMPGAKARNIVTLDELDEAGQVVRTMRLPTNQKGAVPIKADQLRALVPVEKVKASKRKPAAAKAAPKRTPAERRAIIRAWRYSRALRSAEKGNAAITPAAEADAVPLSGAKDHPIDLVARIEALEAVIKRMGLAIGGEAVETQPRRTEREERAIKRAWQTRGAARARADLDARALIAVNAQNRFTLEKLHEADGTIQRLRTEMRGTLDRMHIVEAERDEARADVMALKAKRLAVRETLLRMRARRNEAVRDAQHAQEEARAAVSAMSVLTERWAAVQAVRSDEPRPWTPSDRRPLRLAA